MKTLWFKRKRYGWGWYPSTWQGWLVTFIYVVLVFLLGIRLHTHATIDEIAPQFTIPVVFLTIVFIYVAYKTGETPRWQWGEKDDTDDDNHST